MRTPRDRPHQVRIGCSGWNYDHWRNGVFYPPRLASRNWLRFYAERFDTVEINTTFYRLPKEASVARWVEETPEGFTFTVKVSRYVTHIKRLLDVPMHLPLLYERIRPLLDSPKMGPLLWQLPPTFKVTTSGWSPRSSTCTTGSVTPSSFATRRGSTSGRTRCYASTASRS